MLQTSARLLRLLSLFQGQRYWSGADLAQRLEVTGRTLRRDVDRLRSLGYPVHSTTGAEGGYQLGAGATLPPLLLDDEEAVAVAIGLRTAASGTVAGIEEASMRALLKLEQVLPERLRRRVAALHASIVPISGGGPTVDLKTLSTIAGACRENERLGFGYRDRGGAASARNVEPERLVHTGRSWYLLAWDTGREDWRTFRVDRIEGRVSPGARFTPRRLSDEEAAALVSRAVAYAPYPHRATVRLHASAAAIAQRIPPTVGILEAVDEASCLLRTGAGCPAGLVTYLASFGVDFEVVDPPELMEEVRQVAERLARAVQPSTRACLTPRERSSITSSS
jgi:predicted DNA-binding transcriptional regulator YafY